MTRVRKNGIRNNMAENGQDNMKYITKESESVCVISVGMRFKLPGGDQYILAQTGLNLYCLINLNLGSRWNDPRSLEEIANTLTEHKFAPLA